MTVRKLVDVAQIGVIVGAALYLGFALMDLTVTFIFDYLSP